MLSRQACHALKALLELARAPERWRTTHELATAQKLPEPMLEQVLLRLRRAGVLTARRGRLGGFRLALEPRDLSIAAVLTGLGELPCPTRPGTADDLPGDHVTMALERRLERSRQQALEDLKLQDLLFDLLSAEARSSDSGLLLG
jgi:Rrf2 family protein